LHAAGKLSAACAAKLDALSYAWRTSDDAFAHGLSRARAYADAHGGRLVVPPPCSATEAQPAETKLLREWMRMQQKRHEAGTLPAHHAEELQRMGFVWDDDEAVFHDFVAQLVAYAAAHGNMDVPHKVRRLGPFVSRQRSAARNGTLPAARRATLDAIGFLWEKPLGAPKKKTRKQPINTGCV
jgi:hypothetical protein